LKCRLELHVAIRRTRAIAIGMETATIFAAGFANRITTGALMLLSDQTMLPEGLKTEASDRKVTDNFAQRPTVIWLEALKVIRRHRKKVRHLRFEDGSGGD
jgi:AMP nucleosidase